MPNIIYKPLSFQRKFHFSKKPKVYLSGGYGCLLAGQKVMTIDGPIAIEQITKPTLVKSWNGEKVVWAIASASKSMGVKPCVKIRHDGGELLASESHLIALAQGKYQHALSCLGKRAVYAPSCSYNLHETIAEFCLLEFQRGEPHYSRIALDFLSCCLAYCRQYDRLLRRAKDIAQEIAPLLNGALESVQNFYPYIFEHMDVLTEQTLKYNHPGQCVHQFYKQGFYRHEVAPEAVEEGRASASSPEYICEINQAWHQFLLTKLSHHTMVASTQDCEVTESVVGEASEVSFASLTTTITRTENIGEHEVFDLHVLGTNNYITEDGLVNHNCGKTYSLAMKMFQLMSINEGLQGGILVPTLKMFKRDVLPTIKDISKENKIEYQYNQQDSAFYFPDTDSQVYVFHSEDDGDSIRGPNLAFGLINEVTMCSKGAFDAFLARIRLKNAKLLQLAMSGTPEGFASFCYSYFIENPREDTDLIFGRSRENTFVSDSYFKTLEESYDSLMQKQFIDGEFINLTGNRALWAFNRMKHVNQNAERIHDAPIWISLDFNVNPMAATIYNRLPASLGGPALRAFDEICLNSSDTHEMAQVIRSKYGLNVTIYPDPAGNARSTKSRGYSDISILREAGFTDIRFKPRIISVRDCLNAANNLLDKNQIEVHPRCKNFIADAEQCILKSGGLEIDKSNQARSHWLDGFKQMIDYEFPVIKPAPQIKVGTYA